MYIMYIKYVINNMSADERIESIKMYTKSYNSYNTHYQLLYIFFESEIMKYKLDGESRDLSNNKK